MKKAGIVFAWLSILSLPVMLVMYAIDRFLLKGDIATGSGSSVGGLLVYAIIGVFRDGTGSYWRSYDGNETFFEESVTQTSRGF